MKKIDKAVRPLFKQFTKENIIGKIKFKFAMGGNLEPIEPEIIKCVKDIGFKEEFIVQKVSVIHDDDNFSRVFIECYDANNIMLSLENLEKRELVQSNPEVLKSALNKAIMMLEDYNNMYGDQINKTDEINDLDEILNLH
jgi:hypothetical protein|tara:strand:- start:223 stop:642 length:420 start_codon:yes stop_codon:yes gene_type:complete